MGTFSPVIAGTDRALMKFNVVTIFPEIFRSFLETSLLGKAIADGRIQVSFTDPRDFTDDRHRSTDDAPFGGGDGMVMKPGPLVAALESAVEASSGPGEEAPLRILLTPQGAPLNQATLETLAGHEEVVLVCGRYEGFDERVRSFVDLELSLGDFVLNGGEVAAMALIDGVARLVPGVVGNAGSLETESFNEGLLEYPQYTRPRVFRGREVPEVLIGGDHEKVRTWRRRQMLTRTRDRRPDLWRAHPCTEEDVGLLADEEPRADLASRSYVALLHHPVVDRAGTVVTTAITNLDLHDISRSSRTYGLAGYYVVTPLSSQRELAGRIIDHWRVGHGARYNKRRAEALALLRVAEDLEQVIVEIEAAEGEAPLTVVTSAVRREGQVPPTEVLEQAGARPMLLLLGTGWGLTEEAICRADLAMSPIRGRDPYNHLSVRSAAAILLDRLFGLRD